MPSPQDLVKTEFNPHTIIIPPGRCPSASPGGILFFLPSHSSSLGETAACGVLLPLGWEQGVESPRTIPHQVLPRSRFAGKRVHGFDAYFPHLRRKRLQPFPQTFANALANVCDRGRKRLGRNGIPTEGFGIMGNYNLSCFNFSTNSSILCNCAGISIC